MPFIIHCLGADLFGVYVLIGVITGYFSFLQLGFSAASVKYIAQFIAQKNEDKIRKTFWSCMFIYCFIGLLGMIIIFVLAPVFVDKLLKLSEAYKEICINSFRIAAVGFFCSMLLGLIANTFQALERFDILNRLGVIFVTLQTTAAVLLLKWGFSLTEVITSNVIISLVNFLVYSGYLIKLLPFLKNPSWDLGIVKQLFKFGGFVSISSVVNPLLINSEKIFLSIFRPLASLTYYYVPFSIVNRLSMIPSAFSSVIFPAFSFLQGLNKKEANKELHYRSTLYIFFFYIYFAAFFIVFGAKFFSLWLGDDFARNSSTILTILVLAGLANAIAWPSLVALQGLGKPHVPAIFHSIEIIIYLPCAFILISKFGTIGAAVAWLIRVLTDALLLHTASCNVFGENIFKWYYDLLYRAIAPLAICILSFYWLRTLDLPLLSFFSIAAIFFSMLIYTYIVWKYGLDNFGRGKAVEFLRNLKNKYDKS